MNLPNFIKSSFGNVVYLWAPAPVLFVLSYFFLDDFHAEIIISLLHQIGILLCVHIAVSLIIFIFTKRKLLILVSILTSLILGIFWFQIHNSFYIKNPNTLSSESNKNIKFLVVNLWWKNDKYENILYYISTSDPDVLMLVEFTDIHYSKLKSYLDKNYPYSNLVFDDKNRPFAGNIIFSKYKIKDNSSFIVDGYYSGYVKTTVEIQDNEFDIYLVHTSAPINKDYYEARNNQLDILAKNIDQSRASIVVGDFNLSPWSLHYNNFAKSLNGYSDVTRYTNTDRTWTDDKYPYLIYSHIDHAFVSKEFITDEVKIDDFAGSDHDAINFKLHLNDN